MNNCKTSVKLSLGICIFSSAALLAMTASFPVFIRWLYSFFSGPGPNAADQSVFSVMIPAFYCCVPFAAAALFMLIRLLLNVLKDKVFIMQNVKYFRLISWCCYAVALITLISGIKYIPLLIITFAMAVVGTLLRVVKNIMHSAVEISDENDLTI